MTDAGDDAAPETPAGAPGGGSEPSRPGQGAEQISAIEGIPALSLDAISSVAYGPQAMLVVLATAGAGALAKVEPITVAIVVLLTILVFSYRQVILAYPDGGGCYAVSKANLGRMPSRLAGAALVVDYVLTVAVSIAAGVQALISAFPSLAPEGTPIGLGILALLTALNLRGIATSARALLLPTGVFILGTYVVIVAGFLRSHPAANAGLPHAALPKTVGVIGAFLVLKAFAAGCSALTGVEAIANDVPAFRAPQVRNAMRTEVLLGGLLGTMLLGLSVLTVRFHVAPSAHQTVLSQLTGAAVGRGPVYFVIDLSTTAILAIAANTSFGGLPLLASLLARDDLVPHVFGLRADRPVYRYGVVVLAVLAGALLVAVHAKTGALIPLFAIGVFTGFTLSQTGLVRHWWRTRPPFWWARASLNALGAAMTGVATVIFMVTKFSSGAWVVVIAIPLLILLFSRIHRYYADVARELGFGQLPPVPTPRKALVVVAVAGVSRMTEEALATALSFGPRVVAVSVQFDEERARELERDWARWDPGVPLTVLRTRTRSITQPMIEFLRSAAVRAEPEVLVVIPEVTPRKWRHQVLQNQRGIVLANVLRRKCDAQVVRIPYRLLHE